MYPASGEKIMFTKRWRLHSRTLVENCYMAH